MNPTPGLPTAGFQPTADDYCAYLSQVGSGPPDGSSPVTITPRLSAVEKRRGPRSATSKYRGVSCYKRCVSARRRAVRGGNGG